MSTEPDNHSSDSETADREAGLAPLGWFGLLVVGAWIYPKTPLSDWILCPFRALTELSCAGCGMTRSITAFVRGDWAASWGFHPAGPLLLFALLLFGGLRLADRIAGQKVMAEWREKASAYITPISVVLLVILFLFWGWRLYGEWFL